ncbi:dTDP-4-amino-4,6-dideoxygalactose transaminase [Vibrio panuliri]|uniref:dTDP-4-amino-4,6-dideoxygalactose transaminase n=1 Tax=Vibrio panuliri TaxID=1381081 RepID=A0A1Q9HAJ0_9VIBR|nr:dTDP-4-amino-4,6-dideoxygalactose transaminase [Vibrio panuliri]OLQ86144.1 dTDP-4-amino-4,6-dideoxygalactose transaminase [Vibrio panuliri]
MIPFNIPCLSGYEMQYISQVLSSRHLSGDGPYTEKCHQWFEDYLNCEKVLLTPSCTAALEMAAILIDIKPGDEVIMPSYTFVSTANAFVLRGAKIVFVDIRPDTMNIDETLIEAAITPKTKAIVPVHYAGVACEMDTIMDIAERHNLFVIEDAAQCMMADYKGRALGTIGHLGTYSFHATKNFTSGGEGGLLIINSEHFAQRAEIIREKGTNRSSFINGLVDKYTWVDVGGSHLPSELQAAYLLASLEASDAIAQKRLNLWALYKDNLPQSSQYETCTYKGNAHIFFLKFENLAKRNEFKIFMDKRGITCAPHYIPLHSSTAGEMFGTFFGNDVYTTLESERLIRLPMYDSMSKNDVLFVCRAVLEFINE